MNISIYTFSGTGNTYITADYIARALKSHTSEVSQYKIEEEIIKDEPLDLSGVDHIIIGYPIYAFNAPEMIIDFIKRFPECGGQKISIFKTAGEPFRLNNSSSGQMIRILSKKGYEFVAETLFLMPYNIMFRYPDALAKQMYLLMQDRALDFADKVILGTRNMIASGHLEKAVSFCLRGILWRGGKFNGRLYTCNRKKCTMCMKCVRECPTKNISIKDGRLHFDGNCAICMRCVQRCPAEAINIGLLQFWAVRGRYDFEKLAGDDSIPADFINHDTRGYFRSFRKYFGVKG